MTPWVFEVRRDGTYSARLRQAEREVLADVVGQVVELLGGDLDRAVGRHAPDEDPGRAVGGHRPDEDPLEGHAPDEDPPEGNPLDEDPPEGNPLDLVRLGVGPIPVPIDPAVHRLLPDGSRDDAEIAAEFRRLTEDDLRSTKVGNLLRLRALLLGGPADRVVVPPGEAAAVAAAMTDLRLVVAERLGVRTEEDADDVHRLATELGTEPGADEEGHDLARRLLAVLSVMLGALQDSLVEVMLEAMPDDGAGARDPGRARDPDDRPDTHDEPPDPTRAPR